MRTRRHRGGAAIAALLIIGGTVGVRVGSGSWLEVVPHAAWRLILHGVDPVPRVPTSAWCEELGSGVRDGSAWHSLLLSHRVAAVVRYRLSGAEVRSDYGVYTDCFLAMAQLRAAPSLHPLAIPSVHRLLEHVDSTTWAEREMAVKVIARTDTSPLRTQSLAAAAMDPVRAVRSAAMDGLLRAYTGVPPTPEEILALAPVLSHDNQDTRSRLLGHLRMLGPAASPLVPEMHRRMREEPSEFLRSDLARILSDLESGQE